MIKVACIGITGVITGSLLRQMKSPISEVMSLGCCIMILLFGLNQLSSLFSMLNPLSQYFQEQITYFHILLKIIGMTFVADFSSNLCKDAGYSAIAGQIEMFGKISVMTVSAPVFFALLETINELL